MQFAPPVSTHDLLYLDPPGHTRAQLQVPDWAVSGGVL